MNQESIEFTEKKKKKPSKYSLLKWVKKLIPILIIGVLAFFWQMNSFGQYIVQNIEFRINQYKWQQLVASNPEYNELIFETSNCSYNCTNSGCHDSTIDVERLFMRVFMCIAGDGDCHVRYDEHSGLPTHISRYYGLGSSTMGISVPDFTEYEN